MAASGPTDNGKRAYTTPTLVIYGSITALTQNGVGSGIDGGLIPGMTRPT